MIKMTEFNPYGKSFDEKKQDSVETGNILRMIRT